MVFTKLKCKAGLCQFSLSEIDNYFHFNISCVVSWIHLVVRRCTVAIRCILLATKLPGAHFTLGAKVGERIFDVGVSWTAGSMIPRKGTGHFNTSPTPLFANRKESCKRQNLSSNPALSYVFSFFPSTLSKKPVLKRGMSCADVPEGRVVGLLGLVEREDCFSPCSPCTRPLAGQVSLRETERRFHVVSIVFAAFLSRAAQLKPEQAELTHT